MVLGYAHHCHHVFVTLLCTIINRLVLSRETIQRMLQLHSGRFIFRHFLRQAYCRCTSSLQTPKTRCAAEDWLSHPHTQTTHAASRCQGAPVRLVEHSTMKSERRSPAPASRSPLTLLVIPLSLRSSAEPEMNALF